MEGKKEQQKLEGGEVEIPIEIPPKKKPKGGKHRISDAEYRKHLAIVAESFLKIATFAEYSMSVFSDLSKGLSNIDDRLLMHINKTVHRNDILDKILVNLEELNATMTWIKISTQEIAACHGDIVKIMRDTYNKSMCS